MLNTEKIKKRMAELELKQEYVSSELKMTQGAFNLKLNNKRELKIDEMFAFGDLLEIDPLEYKSYFAMD